MTTGTAEQPAPAWQVMFCGLVRHAAQATEADRGRAALLAAVSHDLRAPPASPRTIARNCWLPPRSLSTCSAASRRACWT
jgi:hypothetical protein